MTTMAFQDDRGFLLITTLMAAMLLIALATGLVAVTSLETLISANYRNAGEGLYAAEAGVELALEDLRSAPDWSAVLAQAPDSRCAGPFGGLRPTEVDPAGLWGADNPEWRPHFCARLADLAAERIDSEFVIAVWIADDPADRDGTPRSDANGILTVRGESYGPMGAHRAVETTVAKSTSGTRVLSWRVVL